ncbi:ATP-dependent DNA ligase [Actinocatenispora rupis]|uniref:Probable DNA ligase n=1 Tax=Actinocatenispora rupis TaxID=519421 RepID=A0A8J3NC51_9ACTN|nr:ATP-dependent DNA ligase [Actinocatenispora rupis]GID11362.1 DNA ligase B [Actinocatenispora rupis]
MLFADLAAVSAGVAATRSRLAKIDLLADCLRRLEPDEVAAGVAYLSGELRQRQIGVGWAGLRELPAAATEPTLSVAAVDATLERIGEQRGAGSAGRRRALVAELFGAATEDERRLLAGLITGEVRQGALAGVMTDAVARAADVAGTTVRRAVLLSGDLRAVAAAALRGGAAELAEFRLAVGRPLSPMLAQPATDIGDAVGRLAADGAEVAVDDKLDGVRVQAHRDGADVAIFTRSLDDITSRVPELVAAVRALPVDSAVLDGEALALTESGRPVPFQVTASRVGRRSPGAEVLPLRPYFFDLLHIDGADVLDEPAARRWAELDRVVPGDQRVGRRMVGTAEAAAERFAAVLAAGHEGVVIKSPTAAYEAGRRGGSWLKVKPRHTLDLVVLAVEWGHGRRRGLLSNLHLGAAGPDGFVMLGKTFKGLTDAMLAWQTERLQQLAVRRDAHVVYVRPELVVEIAFDGVQTSPRYPAGMALRFARVLRYREDKSAAEADTIDTVRAIWRAAGGDGEPGGVPGG